MTSFNRLPSGLVADYPYQYTADGRIDWKALLNVKWLRVKDDKVKDVEKRYGKPVRELDLSKVEDYYLYVTLGGYNEVARLRGFDQLSHHVDHVSESKAVVTCSIRFIPNVEEPTGLICAGVASGSVYNISPDFAVFMETIAENRAFVRAVRRALNINIVGQEELGKGVALPASLPATAQVPDRDPGFQPHVVLANRCKELKISFAALKEAAKLMTLQSAPDTWSDFADIDKGDIWTLMHKVNAGAPVAQK